LNPIFFSYTQTPWFFDSENFQILGTDNSLILKIFNCPEPEQVLQKIKYPLHTGPNAKVLGIKSELAIFYLFLWYLVGHLA